MAYDLGKPAMTSTTEVTVNVQDIGDEVPEFQKEIYDVNLEENVQIGQEVITLNAGGSLYKYSIISKNFFSNNLKFWKTIAAAGVHCGYLNTTCWQSLSSI